MPDTKAHSILMYADSGDTKTSQAYLFCKWYHSLHPEKEIRLISADGGGWAPFEDSGMISEGIVKPYDISAHPLAYGLVNMLSEGYWYKKVRPKGETEYRLKIKPDEAYRESLYAGKVGVYVVEGLTSIAELWRGHLAHSESAGFKHSYKFSETIEGKTYEVGGLDKGHFGILQNELARIFVRGFNTLPIDYLIVTATVNKGEDRQGESIYGPQGAGSAQTKDYPRWFMDCLHLATEIIDTDEGKVRAKVAWIRDHEDKVTDIPYKAKIRVMPELMPKVNKKYPNGYCKLSYKKGIAEMYEFLNSLKGVTENNGETTT